MEAISVGWTSVWSRARLEVVHAELVVLHRSDAQGGGGDVIIGCLRPAEGARACAAGRGRGSGRGAAASGAHPDGPGAIWGFNQQTPRARLREWLDDEVDRAVTCHDEPARGRCFCAPLLRAGCWLGFVGPPAALGHRYDDLGASQLWS